MSTEQFLASARARYVAANAETLRWMLDRPRLYGSFLNTKVNPLTGRDYTDDDGWRGPRFLYGWIQGRGLEALVTHAAFFETEDPALAERLDAAGRQLFEALATLHDRHGGAFFIYDEDLQPIYRGADGSRLRQNTGTGFFTYSDCFVLKGLVAAANRYAPERRAPWLRRMGELVAAIEGGRFIMDEQQALTPSAAAAQHDEYGPRMIFLGGASLLRRLGLDDEARFGDRFISHVFARHWDGIGDNPSWLIRDAVGGDVCNAGHAIEFAGFALEYLPTDADPALLTRLEKTLVASFDTAFSPPGLRLMVSAASRSPLSPNSPWWSLPETTRAAGLLFARTGSPDALRIWTAADGAFFAHYWLPGTGYAYQTRTEAGPIDYVPATPDLDPGYHTGLSFLGAIEAVDMVLAGH
jgi:hypothetical protein